MTHPFDAVTTPSGARLLLTPCPGTKDTSVGAAVNTLKEAGADAVITMLTNADIKKLGVEHLGSEIEQQGIAWFQLPIEDDCAPEAIFEEAFAKSKDELLELLKNKATIAIHCRGGTGRTSLMAAILLLESGESWTEIKPHIQAAKPKTLKIPVHLEYLEKRFSL